MPFRYLPLFTTSSDHVGNIGLLSKTRKKSQYIKYFLLMFLFILNTKINHYIHFQKDEKQRKISWHMKKISSLKEENHYEHSEHMISNYYGKLETFFRACRDSQ